jgi:hypothetical protein
MSNYQQLKNNPPQLSIKGGAREVIFTTISCMCDNVGHLRFKKNEGGDFKLDGVGFAISNWQMKTTQHDLEWLADEAGWDEVIKLINTGTSKIESVKSR